MKYNIQPVPKPRMTQRDKWMKRPAVMRYREFCDLCRFMRVRVENGATINFYLAMPSSWSETKKTQLDGMPHSKKPDVDNLLKALLDAIYDDDSHINDVRVRKFWSRHSYMEIEK